MKREAEERARRLGLQPVRFQGRPPSTPSAIPHFFGEASTTGAAYGTAGYQDPPRWASSADRQSVEDLPDYNAPPTPRQHSGQTKARSSAPPGHSRGPTTEGCRGGNEGGAGHNVAAQGRAAAETKGALPRANWEEFEVKLSSPEKVRFADIPWPSSGERILCARGTPSKKDVRKALLRWHPDKFQKILSRIDDQEERAKAVAMVQEVTRRIIAEKEAASM